MIQRPQRLDREHVFESTHRHTIEAADDPRYGRTVHTTRFQDAVLVMKRQIVQRTEHAFAVGIGESHFIVFRKYPGPVCLWNAGIGEHTTQVTHEYDEVGFANTNSKSVLGSLNDLAFHYKYSILEAGGVHSPAVPKIIRRLNRMPMGALKYVFPIEALKALYQTAER